jgi:membrane-associated phospholipid phosphatase
LISTKVSVFLLVTTLAAQTSADPGDLRDPRKMDAAVTLFGGVTWLTLEGMKASIVADACRWCDRNVQGLSTLNGVDRKFRSAFLWDNPRKAHTVSNVTGFGVSVGTAFGLSAVAAAVDGRSEKIGADALIIAESTILAMNLNQMAKLTFQRQRPFANAMDSELALSVASPENNMSFFSGHATFAFSLAVSAGTVASMRDYRLAPVIWGVGLTTATATSYLRMAADKHYFSDVIVGAAVGSLTGFAVPYFLHRKGKSLIGESISVTGGPVSGGGVVSLAGIF